MAEFDVFGVKLLYWIGSNSEHCWTTKMMKDTAVGLTIF